jgi:predicted PurR-regulated permease PerM
LDKVPQLLSAARSRTAEMLSRYPTILSKLQAIELGGTVGALSHRLAQGLKVGAAAIGGFVFVLVLALYVAIDPEYYLCAFLSVLPPSKRPEAKRLLHEAALALRKWFSSQLIAMIAVGTATAVGLLVIGIDDWLLFGALTAVLDVVPYVGPLIAAATAVVVTFAADPGKTPWVIAVYILMQQFEAHLVIPLVMKERIELPPAHLMVMMLILGRWFGILGILVAPGLLAVLRTVYGSSRSSGPSDAKAA